jgi:hypothetical protein
LDELNNSSQKIVFEPTKQEKHKSNLAAEGKKKEVEKQ